MPEERRGDWFAKKLQFRVEGCLEAISFSHSSVFSS